MFLAVYGRLPAEFSPDVAMGLAVNIPHVEARQTLVMAKAVAIAFGDEEAIRSTYMAAYNDARAVDSILANLQHAKAVASCHRY